MTSETSPNPLTAQTLPKSPPQHFSYQYIKEKIPCLYPNLLSIEELIFQNKHIDHSETRSWKKLDKCWEIIRQNMWPFELEIFPFCGREWSRELQMENGHISRHIIGTLIAAYINPRFKQLDEHDQSIILYSLLFHDIAKRGPPVLCTHDPFHPFACAAVTLGILNRAGWVANPEAVKETVAFIEAAKVVTPFYELMDNSQLNGIFRRLLYVTGVWKNANEWFLGYREACGGVEKEKMFVLEVVLLVLLHQSVNFDCEYPNFTPLCDEDILVYFSPRLLYLLGIVNAADGGSYHLNRPIGEWECKKNNEKEVDRLMSLFK
jgi:hypothetical protein